MDCLNLKELFGEQYRIDASFVAENPGRKRCQDPWYYRIPCEHGEIYPHGGELLGAATHRRGKIAKQIAAVPEVRVVQDGVDGINAVFHHSNFEAVAALLKPRRRRRLSAEHRARLADSGAKALAEFRNCQRGFADAGGPLDHPPPKPRARVKGARRGPDFRPHSCEKEGVAGKPRPSSRKSS